MTNKVMKLIAKKRHVFRKYKNNTHPACILVSKETSKAVKKARWNLEKMLARNIKTDKKSFFAYIRGKSKLKSRSGPLINKAGDIITDLKETANKFNKYFSSVFTKEDWSSTTNSTSTSSTYCQFSASDITEDIVRSKLTRLRPDKAGGADNLVPGYKCIYNMRLVTHCCFCLENH